MTAPTMQQPVVPPRPSKSPAKDLLATSPSPLVPPRPVNKRVDRSKSPNPDRFAQSPFTDGVIAVSPLGAQFSPSDSNGGSTEAAHHHETVPMPSVGEEGLEYSIITSELQGEGTESAEQTRTVAQDLKLHAPKPSLPASSAKERVMNVTRTDSDKAASFGIGKPAHLEGRSTSRNGLRKKSSTSFSTTSEQDHQIDDEHGIPEIGQRVPMNPHLGDVQAPSPAPAEGNGNHHSRKHSSRGLPPGSYGMHGHGVESQDELDKAYYKKHPELLQREHHTPLHDRQNDFAMSSSDLNKLVRDTANRRSGIDFHEAQGTPNDEVAFQAHEELASRMATPRPASIVAKEGGAPLEDPGASEDKPIHVDDPKHPEQYSYGAESPVDAEGNNFEAPILAADEIEKDAKRPAQTPAIRPHLDRNSSSYDGTSRPTSRPSSRPTSIYNAYNNVDFDHTPLEDVHEYEPLFPDEAAKKEEEEKRQSKEGSKARHYFPSKDVWEDAPTSVHYTAEVSTPDNTQEEDQQRRKSSTHFENRPITPAQAFAMQQEELAEKEANGKKHNFLPILEAKPTWVDHQPHLKSGKTSTGHRFPSKDVWEDTPESLLYEAEVEEKPKDEKKPEVPARPSKKLTELLSHTKPAVPERPKSRPSGDEAAPRPAVPSRPVKKLSGDSKDGEVAKPKPPVPSRPVGGKIAALQAGFMSDLNKRLQLGPQAAKKEEDKAEPAEEKEKVPLSDARKSRARGPQRRAPTKAEAPAAAPAPNKDAAPVSLSFSLPQTIWNIDPELGDVHVASDSPEVPVPEVAVESKQSPPPPPAEIEKPAELEKPALEEDKVSEPPVKAVEAEAPKEPVEPVVSPEPAVSEPEPVPVPEPAKEPEEPKDLESAKEPEVTLEVEEPKVPEEPEKLEEVKQPEEPVKEETIAANTAGESILEAQVAQKDEQIEPVEVTEEVKS